MLQELLKLAGALPSLLAALVGVAMARLLWTHARRAAGLLLMASLLDVLMQIGVVWFYHFYLLAAMQGAVGTRSDLLHLSSIVGMGRALMQALIYGLLIAAVLADRRRPPAQPTTLTAPASPPR